MIRIIIYILLSISLFSCATKEKDPQENSSTGHLPDWVVSPTIQGKIAAVGIAPKSKGGLQFQIPQAEADARANIAAQINTEVSKMTKDALRSANVSGNSEVENVFSQVTKNLVKKIPLRGSKRVNMYKDPADGTLYIQMALDNKMIAEHFAENKKLYSKALQESATARELIDQSEAAVQNLYDELEESLDD